MSLRYYFNVIFGLQNDDDTFGRKELSEKMVLNKKKIHWVLCTT